MVKDFLEVSISQIKQRGIDHRERRIIEHTQLGLKEKGKKRKKYFILETFIDEWIACYDKTPELRELHSRLMKEWRKLMSEVCSLANKFNEDIQKKIISEYVNLTINNKEVYWPEVAYEMIKKLVCAILEENIKMLEEIKKEEQSISKLISQIKRGEDNEEMYIV